MLTRLGLNKMFFMVGLIVAELIFFPVGRDKDRQRL